MKHLVTLFLLLMGLTASAQTIMNIYLNNGSVLQIPMSSIDSITYTVNDPGDLATLSTVPPGSITATIAVSGGDITEGGGTPVTQRGVCWSTAPNPTTAHNITNDGSGVGNYASNLTGLVAGSTYYVRAYAINSAGTAYGNQVQFTTAGAGGGFVSNPGAGVTFDGYTYPSVVFGNGQEWMAENLRTTTYANGSPIPNVTANQQWEIQSYGMWAHYENNSSYENPYGKLYNWYAVADPRNVCPAGWHVPTNDEWASLTGYLGGVESLVGGKMKAVSSLWNPPNIGATNESGFSGLPGGNRVSNGYFFSFGTDGYWWTASEGLPGSAYARNLVHDYAAIYQSSHEKERGFSVRCLRD